VAEEGQSPLVGIITGSASDLPVVHQTVTILDKLEIPNEVRVISAHRTPDAVDEYARTAEDRRPRVIICGAGLAAHRAGAVAARTVLPVIGVPIWSKYLNGLDALYSTVMMPRGVPVATVAIDGATNAAILAAQIIGVGDEDVRRRLRQFKEDLAEGLKL
jgi:5-(carboxyamino)imidazole ribonucleotide mutase